MEHWSGTLEWSTGVFKLNVYDLNFTVAIYCCKCSIEPAIKIHKVKIPSMSFTSNFGVKYSSSL